MSESNKYIYDDPEDQIDFEDDSAIGDNGDDNTINEPKPSKKKLILLEILSYIKIVIIAFLIAFVFTHFIIVNAQVPTGSMKETINEGDRLIGFRLAYLFSAPQRGDIVVFKYPDDESQDFVKRVIGTPGDTVTIRDGKVYVNEEPIDEPYLREPMIPTDMEQNFIVPEGHYFMMGDNRNSSYDSRYWTHTFVSKDKIIAKIAFRYYNGYTKSISFSSVK